MRAGKLEVDRLFPGGATLHGRRNYTMLAGSQTDAHFFAGFDHAARVGTHTSPTPDRS